jgi:hypothetical protein
MKTYYFTDCSTLNEVKKLFKILALRHHPDRPGGDNNRMQEINDEYHRIINDPLWVKSKQTAEEQQDSLKYPEIINKIINLDLIIEIIGNWIWLSGNTWKYKAKLKEVGFMYSPQKKMWYWRPSAWKSTNHEPWSINKIRSRFGSDIILGSGQVELYAK